MKSRLVPALVAVLLACAACGGAASPEASDLARARSLWEAAGITSYRYTIDRVCFCPPVSKTVTVVDGAVTSVEVTPANSAFTTGWTMEELFDELDAILNRTDRGDVAVEYDAERGYPKSVTADPVLRATDDEFSYTVTDFEVLSG